MFLGLLKFLPRGGLWGHMVLDAAVRGEPDGYVTPADRAATMAGQRGVAVTPLLPSGQVEIAGKRYEARLAVGSADAGAPVVVTRQGEFSLIVEVLS
jgi:membrane-bound serine protease (ClpP class)